MSLSKKETLRREQVEGLLRKVLSAMDAKQDLLLTPEDLSIEFNRTEWKIHRRVIGSFVATRYGNSRSVIKPYLKDQFIPSKIKIGTGYQRHYSLSCGHKFKIPNSQTIEKPEIRCFTCEAAAYSNYLKARKEIECCLNNQVV